MTRLCAPQGRKAQAINRPSWLKLISRPVATPRKSRTGGPGRPSSRAGRATAKSEGSSRKKSARVCTRHARTATEASCPAGRPATRATARSSAPVSSAAQLCTCVAVTKSRQNTRLSSAVTTAFPVQPAGAMPPGVPARFSPGRGRSKQTDQRRGRKAASPVCLMNTL